MRCLFTFLFAVHAGAALFPTDRLVDWTLAGVEGGIPIRTTIYTNLTSGASAATINSAIANCPSNQVVKLGEGTYTLSSVIELKNGVTLRGSGTNTILVSSLTEFNNDSLISMGSDSSQFFDVDYSTANETSWDSGYARGTTEITVGSATGLFVGQLIGMDQLDGGIVTATDTYIARDSGTRAQQAYRRITAINGTTLTIYPELYATNWTSVETPEIFWPSTATSLMMAGVEDMTVDNNDRSSGCVKYYNAQNCWVYNCRLINPKRHHIGGQFGLFLEFRGNTITDWSTISSSFYGIEPWNASFVRVEDNICYQYVNCLTAMAMSCSVVAFNAHFEDQGIGASQSWNLFEHAGHCHHNLYEGNFAIDTIADDLGGNQSYKLVFRNRLTGYESGVGTGWSFRLMSDMWHFSVIGNVMGTPGHGTTYESASQGNFIWCWDAGTSDARDDTSFGTFVRAGNYDVTTATNNGVRWDGTIETIPDSYAYASKPDYFGILGWPPYDSLGTLTVMTNTLAYTNIPAGYRFLNGTNPPAAASEATEPVQRIQIRGPIRTNGKTRFSLIIEPFLSPFVVERSADMSDWLAFFSGADGLEHVESVVLDSDPMRFYRLMP